MSHLFITHGQPAADDGLVGDYALEPDHRILYGPKAGDGTWPSVRLHVGQTIEDGEGVVQFDLSDGVIFPNLPDEDPEVVGQLWNDSGDPKISAGPPP